MNLFLRALKAMNLTFFNNIFKDPKAIRIFLRSNVCFLRSHVGLKKGFKVQM